MKRILLAFSILILLSSITAQAGQFKVTRVYDGDTFKATGHDITINVRLVGVDSPETKKRKQIIINAIEKCQTVFLPVEFVSLLDIREQDSEGKKILLELSPSDLEEIQGKCVNKIKSFIREKKLSKAPNLEAILYRWKEWENIEIVKNYVDELIRTDEGLWDFLVGFTSETLSTSGDYKIIHQKSVNEFTDFDNIEKRIEEIVLEQGSELTEKQKEVVNALKNGKRKDLRLE